MSVHVGSDSDRFVLISGRRVRIRVRGQGPPVLLLNGLGANVAMWTPLLEQLPGFQLISFDAPGTGLSKAPVLPYRIAHIAAIARRVLDVVGVDRADVLGYSLGGAVAQQLAYSHPERVRRLVLVSTSCGLGQIPGPLRAAFAVMTPARHYAKTANRAFMRLVGLAPAERDSHHITELVSGWRQEATPSVRGYALQMTAFTTFNSLPWLHRVKQPALVVTGTHDNLMPMPNAAVLAAYLNNARLHVVERWGHYFLHDASSGVAASIAEFLAAPDYAASSTWANARPVQPADLPAFIEAAPRTAHWGTVTGGVVRVLFPPKSTAG